MKDRIKDILKNMTPEEKVELLNGKGSWRSRSNQRLNIPEFIMTDGTHGVRYSREQIDEEKTWSLEKFLSIVNQNPNDTGNQSESDDIYHTDSKPATCFPNGSCVGCSWDVDLLFGMGSAIGKECSHMGVNLLLGPGINIRRTPLAGRGYEYYSEDPVISGDLAAAFIEGVQGQGVGACLKHLACNNSEILRTSMDSIVEERALREIYLHGFERAVQKSKPWVVMSSYNLLNGVPASQNKWLLTDVLRNEWGFSGIVVSDWMSIKERPASLLAGNDFEMPECPENNEELLKAVKNGEVPESVLDESCERMLRLVFKLKELEKRNASADFAKHHELARKIAAESIVLLKNDNNILPLDADKNQRIAVIGKGAVSPIIQGSGCATVNPAFIDIPLDCIKDNAGCNCEIFYARGTNKDDIADENSVNEALDIAKKADVVIMFANTANESDGEGADRKDLALLTAHEKLINEISRVNRNIIVVLSNSDAVVMPWLSNVKAVIETFFAGQGMGKALADTIFGKVNPSGKLTVTMPKQLEDTPAFIHYPGENYKHIYSEGIYVGYRYYDKRKIEPLFPFGYGLSYTTFKYSSLRFNKKTINEEEFLNVSVDITNTGTVFGKEIVQLYVCDKESHLARPVQELKAFTKVGLKPDETKTVTFQLGKRDFAFYDPAFNTWIVETGEFEIRIGKSSRDIVLSDTITVISSQKYYPLIYSYTPFSIVIKNPIAIAKLSRYIAEKANISIDSAEKIMHTALNQSFCGVYKTIVSMMKIKIEKDEFEDLLEQINTETLRA